jgi:DNA-directed RNA polymerase subunit RPC12/RpoP
MIDYCGRCSKRTNVKPCLLDENMEEYFCAKCRRELSTAMKVEVLRER